MADYPDWVLKHKKKGTYINHSNGRYYLYAAHSERVKGTNKVRRVCDGYIGRITEKDGLIPTKTRKAGSIRVYEYGLSKAIVLLSHKIYKGMKREFRANADFVMVSGILNAIYNCISQELYETSYLSTAFPGIDLSKKATEKQQSAIDRTSLMVMDKFKMKFGGEYQAAMNFLSLAHSVKSGDSPAYTVVPDVVKAFAAGFGIDLEGGIE